jgi:hypothetical protein
MSCIDEMYTNEEHEAPPHYHNNVSDFLNTHLLERWVEYRGSAEYHPDHLT